MEAIGRATINPARWLEKSSDTFKRKGRLQIGADADLVLFDPDKIMPGAAYGDPYQPSVGMPEMLNTADLRSLTTGAKIPCSDRSGERSRNAPYFLPDRALHSDAPGLCVTDLKARLDSEIPCACDRHDDPRHTP